MGATTKLVHVISFKSNIYELLSGNIVYYQHRAKGLTF